MQEKKKKTGKANGIPKLPVSLKPPWENDEKPIEYPNPPKALQKKVTPKSMDKYRQALLSYSVSMSGVQWAQAMHKLVARADFKTLELFAKIVGFLPNEQAQINIQNNNIVGGAPRDFDSIIRKLEERDHSDAAIQAQFTQIPE
jgi:hypothetical protein